MKQGGQANRFSGSDASRSVNSSGKRSIFGDIFHCNFCNTFVITLVTLVAPTPYATLEILPLTPTKLAALAYATIQQNFGAQKPLNIITML